MEILVFVSFGKRVTESITTVYETVGYIANHGGRPEELWAYDRLEDVITDEPTAFVLSEHLLWIPAKKCYAFWDSTSGEAKEIPPEESEWGFLLPPIETVKDWVEVLNGRRVHTQLP